MNSRLDALKRKNLLAARPTQFSISSEESPSSSNENDNVPGPSVASARIPLPKSTLRAVQDAARAPVDARSSGEGQLFEENTADYVLQPMDDDYRPEDVAFNKSLSDIRKRFLHAPGKSLVKHSALDEATSSGTFGPEPDVVNGDENEDGFLPLNSAGGVHRTYERHNRRKVRVNMESTPLEFGSDSSAEQALLLAESFSSISVASPGDSMHRQFIRPVDQPVRTSSDWQTIAERSPTVTGKVESASHGGVRSASVVGHAANALGPIANDVEDNEDLSPLFSDTSSERSVAVRNMPTGVQNEIISPLHIAEPNSLPGAGHVDDSSPHRIVQENDGRLQISRSSGMRDSLVASPSVPEAGSCSVSNASKNTKKRRRKRKDWALPPKKRKTSAGTVKTSQNSRNVSKPVERRKDNEANFARRKSALVPSRVAQGSPVAGSSTRRSGQVESAMKKTSAVSARKLPSEPVTQFQDSRDSGEEVQEEAPVAVSTNQAMFVTPSRALLRNMPSQAGSSRGGVQGAPSKRALALERTRAASEERRCVQARPASKKELCMSQMMENSMLIPGNAERVQVNEASWDLLHPKIAKDDANNRAKDGRDGTRAEPEEAPGNAGGERSLASMQATDRVCQPAENASTRDRNVEIANEVSSSRRSRASVTVNSKTAQGEVPQQDRPSKARRSRSSKRRTTLSTKILKEKKVDDPSAVSSLPDPQVTCVEEVRQDAVRTSIPEESGKRDLATSRMEATKLQKTLDLRGQRTPCERAGVESGKGAEVQQSSRESSPSGQVQNPLDDGKRSISIVDYDSSEDECDPPVPEENEVMEAVKEDHESSTVTNKENSTRSVVGSEPRRVGRTFHARTILKRTTVDDGMANGGEVDAGMPGDESNSLKRRITILDSESDVEEEPASRNSVKKQGKERHVDPGPQNLELESSSDGTVLEEQGSAGQMEMWNGTKRRKTSVDPVEADDSTPEPFPSPSPPSRTSSPVVLDSPPFRGSSASPGIASPIPLRPPRHPRAYRRRRRSLSPQKSTPRVFSNLQNDRPSIDEPTGDEGVENVVEEEEEEDAAVEEGEDSSRSRKPASGTTGLPLARTTIGTLSSSESSSDSDEDERDGRLTGTAAELEQPTVDLRVAERVQRIRETCPPELLGIQVFLPDTDHPDLRRSQRIRLRKLPMKDMRRYKYVSDKDGLITDILPRNGPYTPTLYELMWAPRPERRTKRHCGASTGRERGRRRDRDHPSFDCGIGASREEDGRNARATSPDPPWPVRNKAVPRDDESELRLASGVHIVKGDTALPRLRVRRGDNDEYVVCSTIVVPSPDGTILQVSGSIFVKPGEETITMRCPKHASMLLSREHGSPTVSLFEQSDTEELIEVSSNDLQAGISFRVPSGSCYKIGNKGTNVAMAFFCSVAMSSESLTRKS